MRIKRMALHPSASWSFDDLSRELEDRVSRGLVRSTTAPDAPHLTLYVYKKSTEHDKLWDDVTMMARGITLDYRARVIRSRPFAKFFNYGERTLEIPNGPVALYDKPDGSLATLFHDGDRWRVTSKGGFTSPQSQWSEMHLREKANMGAFCVGDTYLMEAIYRADRKVVRYDFEGLIVLAAYAADGRAYTREEVEAVAAESGLRCVERLHYASFKEMLQAVSQFDRDREGCVAHFVDTDYRVKAKGAEYLRVMRILSRVTPVSVWEVMLDGDAAAMRREIPEEFWGDFDAIAGAIEKRLSDTIAAIDRECERLADKSNREIAAAIDTIPEPARRFVLTRRKRGALMMTDKITRRAVFQTFRPTGNVLEGYTPSESIKRMDDE